jgi:hypothetical protein
MGCVSSLAHVTSSCYHTGGGDALETYFSSSARQLQRNSGTYTS